MNENALYISKKRVILDTANNIQSTSRFKKMEPFLSAS